VPTILSVAYPLAPVGPDATGGAEQILTTLEAGLVQAGWRSIVIACEGSEVAGTLVALPRAAGTLTRREIDAQRRRAAELIRRVLATRQVDLVHMHGVDFAAYLPPNGPPVLATLHCPADWYPDEALSPSRPATWLNAVSEAQHATFAPNPRLLAPIPNGVPLEATDTPAGVRGRFAVVLARIAPEKGIPHAIDAAKRAGLPLLIAGQVFGYPDHARHFREEIAPRLDPLRRWIGPIGASVKRQLLARARCLLVSSLVPETSSLSAREALAAGTPVIAFNRGALAETVEHGRTGFLVETVAEMAEAVRDAERLDPAACRQTAAERFDARVMVDRYIDAYRHILRNTAPWRHLQAVPS
jgi:glycosyltransferase involved in cell wall biosynthesis